MAKSPAPQQVVITIGHISLLLPDDTGAATVIKTLSRALPCFHYSGARKVELRSEHIEVSMAYIGPQIPIVSEDGHPVAPATRHKQNAQRILALKPPGYLALTEGSSRS